MFDDIASNSRINARRAAGHVAEDMLREMKQRTPVDEGILRGTLHLIGPEWHGDVLEMAWVAGGPSAQYAIVQHENEEYSHTVGESKFITKVVDARASEIDDAIADNIIKTKKGT